RRGPPPGFPAGPPAGPSSHSRHAQVSTRGRSRPMTVAAGHVSTERTAPIPLPDGRPEPAKVPRLADGVELLGEYQGSGYSQPPSLVRRAAGQVLQMPRLLYQLTCRIDGSRGPAAIAELVSGDLGRSLTADQVRHLITSKLLPLGIVADEGAPAVLPKA